jgi:hypothetical protein
MRGFQGMLSARFSGQNLSAWFIGGIEVHSFCLVFPFGQNVNFI